MMKVIVYARPDGGVTVVGPAPQRITELMSGGMTEDEAIAVIQARSVPGDATNVEVMDRAVIPTSREFRDAWEKLGTGGPTVNMVKARGIHMRRIARDQTDEIARLGMEERKERLNGNTTLADQHAADAVTLGALDLTALATQIAAASNPTVLSAIWPLKVPHHAT